MDWENKHPYPRSLNLKADLPQSQTVGGLASLPKFAPDRADEGSPPLQSDATATLKQTITAEADAAWARERQAEANTEETA
jgi:hypothetical protein